MININKLIDSNDGSLREIGMILYNKDAITKGLSSDDVDEIVKELLNTDKALYWAWHDGYDEGLKETNFQ
jgi:hypothetical protein